jgi:uncharacterized protein YegP (UPF0339 family)
MDNPKYQIFRSSSNYQYYYHLQSANGEKILSGEGYTTKESCKTGILSVKTNAPLDNRYERKDSPTYTFNLKGANGEIIGRSESYTTSHNRENGISAVKRDAPGVPIEDLA